MSIWVEFRCERRLSAPANVSPTGVVGSRCWSHDNRGPMYMAADDQRSVLALLRELAREARAMGWKRTREGWVCPHCASRPVVKTWNGGSREAALEAAADRTEKAIASGCPRCGRCDGIGALEDEQQLLAICPDCGGAGFLVPAGGMPMPTGGSCVSKPDKHAYFHAYPVVAYRS